VRHLVPRVPEEVLCRLVPSAAGGAPHYGSTVRKGDGGSRWSGWVSWVRVCSCKSVLLVILRYAHFFHPRASLKKSPPKQSSLPPRAHTAAHALAWNRITHQIKSHQRKATIKSKTCHKKRPKMTQDECMQLDEELHMYHMGYHGGTRPLPIREHQVESPMIRRLELTNCIVHCEMHQVISDAFRIALMSMASTVIVRLSSRVAHFVAHVRIYSLLDNPGWNHEDQRPTARSIVEFGGKCSDQVSKDSVLLTKRYWRGRGGGPPECSDLIWASKY